MDSLTPGVDGFRYEDLHDPARLADLHAAFLDDFRRRDPEGAAAWGRATAPSPADLIRASAALSAFVATLFRIEPERAASIAAHDAETPVMRFKKEIVLRRAARLADAGDFDALRADLRRLTGPADDEELAVARLAVDLLDLEPLLRPDPKHPKPPPPDLPARLARLRARGPGSDLENLDRLLDLVTRFARAALGHLPWPSLRLPEDLAWPDGLVHVSRPDPAMPNRIEGLPGLRRRRDGFALTDPRWSLREALDHAHYCILCHERDKDSCTKGLPLPRKDKPVQRNPLGVPLAGCPLEERIGEMHAMKRKGDTIAALALIMVDNPMCPITGHRICNDCMKACIYQKQEPVNIPQIETRVLTDVLDLPWGVEIYGLLTRWNPLHVARPFARPYNGRHVLIAGMGPAGFALAQYLLNEGFGCVGIDGLKIEPLSDALLRAPVKDWATIRERLDDRISAGFGGVAEYGITVRWDKNFLKLVALTLMRRRHFAVYGGVRLGGTITLDDAWPLGFDHVAIASGAGKPTVVDMKNNLLPGIRKASDFLMALQLTGAFKKSSLANLQLRLPVVVIGGGLTAIDTATEALAYYPVQVEKTLDRHETLVRELGEAAVLQHYRPDERAVLEEFLAHGRAVRAERARAAAAGEPPDFVRLVNEWGGVSLCYRKSMQDSPAYRLNHEEIAKCLEEGVRFLERLDPREAIPDASGWVSAVRFDTVTLPARTVLVAAGTSPNTTYSREHAGSLAMDAKGRFYAGFNVRDGRLVPAAQTSEDPGFFTSYQKDGRFVTYYGDNHPVYAGSVVKAVASAKDGAKDVAALFPPATASEDGWRRLKARLDDELRPVVTDVLRLTPTIVEVIIRAPMQSRRFRPGQFFRLQNFETLAPVIDGTRLQMEGIALTGAWVDPDRGLLSLIALELGASTRLCATLRKGDPVIVMGPTGAPSEILPGENVVLCGGGLGNAVLFSIARAMRAAGCRVLYFAGYKKADDVFHRGDIEAGADMVVWSTDGAPGVEPRRAQDRGHVGNIVETMVAYAEGRLGAGPFALRDTDRILAIGSDRMMAAVQQARHGVLAPHLKPGHAAVASVNSPMQCMMKEICAQCLQRHVDPRTGREEYVFSCFNQDQPMDRLDWRNLNDRLRQNTVQERQADLWLEHLLRKAPELRRV